MIEKPTNGTCVFTVVSRNYLHFARTLMASVREHAPDVDLVVVLCDVAEGISVETELFTLLEIASLEIENFPEFVFRYDILELNTAVKPFVIRKLMSSGYDSVIYFDPDIRIYSSLAPMLDLVSQNNLVLTPHLTGELDDGKSPGEVDILRAGTYNLGYIGVNNTEEARRFLGWWAERLRTRCVNDIDNGYFVDQKWIELVPSLFDGVYINRDESWNVAYWNLNHREVAGSLDAGYTVNDALLVFFHFSGFVPRKGILSIHQNRLSLKSCGPVLANLFKRYGDELRANDRDGISKSPYAYGAFGNGTSIAPVLRRTYREGIHSNSKQAEDFAGSGPPRWLIDAVNQPAELGSRSTPLVTKLGHRIYRERPDLQLAFPDLAEDAAAFAGWFVASLSREYGLSDEFTGTVRQCIDFEDHNVSISYRIRRGVFSLYKSSPGLRSLVGRRISHATKQRIVSILLSRRPVLLGRRAVARTTHPVTRVFQGSENGGLTGLNVLGYLCAESGVGEAGRSTIRACRASGIDISAIDIRTNNVSRMEEMPDVVVQSRPQFPINLFHVNADQTPCVFDSIPGDFHEKRYNIGFWFWELEDLPDNALKAFSRLDEVWVASSFCQKAVSRQAMIPVSLIPLCVEIPDAEPGPAPIDLPEDSFIVYSCMDMLSVPERKNPIGVLKTFERFHRAAGEKVHLVLKLTNFEKCERKLREVIQEYCNRLPVTLVDEYLHRRDLNNLMRVSDCYLSLHRSEGFGLPIAEAMSMGIPVVATGWSANMDFMNQWNSFPVAYKMIEIKEDQGPYHKGKLWADIDLDDAVRCLLKVFRDPGEAAIRAERALKDISSKHSPEVIGNRIRERLQVIAGRF